MQMERGKRWNKRSDSGYEVNELTELLVAVICVRVICIGLGTWEWMGWMGWNGMRKQGETSSHLREEVEEE